MVFVSGMIGWNADGVFESDDFAGAGAPGAGEHRRGAAEAGARPEHIVRMTWYVVDRDEYLPGAAPASGRHYRRRVPRRHRRHYPAMSGR
jgi:enamine deaminase RidA (YjgF/YER057c/UK114 family)